MDKEGDYQSLTRLIEQQVIDMTRPVKYDARMARLAHKFNFSSRKIQTVLEKVNNDLKRRAQSHFSKQAIAQVSDQISQLWMEKAEQQRESVRQLDTISIPIDLQPNEKLYIMDEVVESVKLLPELLEDDLKYRRYNQKRRELQEKSDKLESLKKRRATMKRYTKLIQLKIGERTDIQRVLNPHRNEIREELTKLTIMLEKLKSLEGEDKEKLKELLTNTID